MSRINCVNAFAYEATEPLAVGTIAMFEVICPSSAFNVETIGRVAPCGHSVRNPNAAGGTTVALVTYACAFAGAPHALPVTFTSSSPLNGCDPAGTRVSNTRHGVRLYSDNPPAAGAAK